MFLWYCCCTSCCLLQCLIFIVLYFISLFWFCFLLKDGKSNVSFLFWIYEKKCTGSKHKHILLFEKRKTHSHAVEKAKKKLPSSFLWWKHPLKNMLERKQSQTEEERSLFDPSSAIWSILAQCSARLGSYMANRHTIQNHMGQIHPWCKQMLLRWSQKRYTEDGFSHMRADTAAFPIVPNSPLLEFIAVKTAGLLAVLIASYPLNIFQGRQNTFPLNKSVLDAPWCDTFCLPAFSCYPLPAMNWCDLYLACLCQKNGLDY